MASRLLRNAVKTGATAFESAAPSRKAMRYIRWWAAQENRNRSPS